MLKLAWKNVTGRTDRMWIAIVIMALTVMAVTSMWDMYRIASSGLELSRERMGADVLIYPAAASGNDEDILFTGSTEMIYMKESDIMAAIPMDMVETYTNEFYINTLPSAGCCATDKTYRIVGIETSSDFLILPWMRREGLDSLSDNDIIVGSNVDLTYGDNTTVLNHTYDVAGILYKTGTSLDESLYISMDSARQIAEKNYSSNYFDYNRTSDVVSSCFIKLKDGVTIEEFREAFEEGDKDASYKVIGVSEAQQMREEKSESLFSIVWLLMLVLIAVSVLALYSLYSSRTERRKKEFGYLRMIGMTDRKVKMETVLEAVMLSVPTALLGALMGTAIFVLAFDRLRSTLSLPAGVMGGGALAVNMLTIAALAVVVSIISTLIPAVKHLGYDPHSAMSDGLE